MEQLLGFMYSLSRKFNAENTFLITSRLNTRCKAINPFYFHKCLGTPWIIQTSNNIQYGVS